MLEKMKAARDRSFQIDEMLSDPDVLADRARCLELIREKKRLVPFVEELERYETAERSLAEVRLILAGDPDAELFSLAEEERIALEAALDESSKKLRQLLLPRDPDADRNVILEIRAGAGGEEAALFAADLYRMYMMFAERMKFKTELLNENETELGGFREVSVRISGDGAFDRFRFESGVHRVQRIPVTESNGKIQTSTVTVATLPEAEDVEIDLNPADLTVETIKSSGAGGQHINKTESAVRIVHKPSGLVVEARNERSQLQNKEQALRVLRTKLYEIKKREADNALSSTRRSQIGTGDRSEKIRTYHFPQNRVTDHRIGLTLYSLNRILNGEMEELVDALLAAETAENLRKSSSGN